VSATNLNHPVWDFELEDPFTLRAARVGTRAGGTELGASLYELGAGAVASPFHFHHNNEELLIVLSGSPQLRRPDGRHQLAAGDVVALLPGRDGAHRLENDGPESARVLIVSTMRFPDVADHPDSGKVLIVSGPPGSGGEAVAFRYDAEVHPLDGESDFAVVLERDLRAAEEAERA
jgi:uncharacterized cupin superfamily protein